MSPPKISAPSRSLRPQPNRRFAPNGIIAPYATEIVIGLMSLAVIRSQRKNLRPAAREQLQPLNKVSLLATQPRVHRPIDAKKIAQALVFAAIGDKQLAELVAFERANADSGPDDIGEFAAREQIDVGISCKRLEGR